MDTITRLIAKVDLFAKPLSLNFEQGLVTQNKLGKFDIITSRAFATIEKTTNLTKTNTHENTKYLLLKGKASNIKKELKDIDKNMFRYEIINQDTTKERNIVLLCKDE